MEVGFCDCVLCFLLTANVRAFCDLVDFEPVRWMYPGLVVVAIEIKWRKRSLFLVLRRRLQNIEFYVILILIKHKRQVGFTVLLSIAFIAQAETWYNGSFL